MNDIQKTKAEAIVEVHQQQSTVEHPDRTSKRRG